MLNLGIYVDTKAINLLDYSNPSLHNPGISGTGIQLLIFIENISKKADIFNIIQYSNEKSKLTCCTNIILDNQYDAVNRCGKDNVDIFITNNPYDEKLLKLLSENKIKTIFWVHNYLHLIHLKKLKMLKNDYRIVFCGRQLYDRYIDDDIVLKSTYIFNMIPTIIQYEKPVEDRFFHITYIGAIIPSKGFHLIADQWSRVLTLVPNAFLNVIGTGALYDSDVILGEYNLAESKYENILINKLLKADPLLASVKFHGILGEDDKRKVIAGTKVGLINPSARTETFGISSTDFQQQGIPVLIRKKNGLVDTYIDGITGLGFNCISAIPKLIKRLYSDKSLYNYLTINGPSFIESKFNISQCINEWINLIVDFDKSELPKYKTPEDNFMNNFKIIRLINRFLRFNLKFKFLSSLIFYESTIAKLLSKFRQY
jgi:glycosyltransferase involved in cell wall biosynthesis